MSARTLTISPFELVGGGQGTIDVTIALVDDDNQRIQGLVTDSGQPVIDLHEASVSDTPVTLDIWPQPDLYPILNYESNADEKLSFYLCSLENRTTRYRHVFRTQVATGGSLSWSEFASGVIPPLPGGEITTITHGELDGLGEDDHPQYHTDIRGDARYTSKTSFDAHAGALPEAAHIPSGGTEGKFLAKAGASDFDLEWRDVGINTIGEAVPGTGNVWDDVNAHCFSGVDSDGACRMCIGANDVAYVGHSGIVYRYFGPTEVCIGSGGAGGAHPHYLTTDQDWVATGSTDHTALSNRDAADSHPQAAITDLVADQTTQNTRLDTAEAHAANTANPHAVTKAQVGLGAADDTADLDKPISNATQTALDAKIGAVEEDTAPILGGKLRTNGNNIVLSNDEDLPFGQLLVGIGIEGDYVALAKTDVDGNFDFNDGAIVVLYGQMQLLGAAIKIDAFAESGAGNRQVFVNEAGQLYTVVPPDPGWSESDTDAGDYDLGTGTTPQPWVELSGLAIALQQAVADGNRIDVYTNVNVVNKTGNRSGNIQIGFGVDGVAPSTGSNVSVPPGFDGYASVNLSTTTHGGLATDQIISVFARIVSGSHNQFGVDLIGSLGEPHEMIVSVPAGQ